MALQCVEELDLGPIAAKQRVDLYKVLATYNFHFWFDGSKAVVILDPDAPVVATVSVTGRALIYAPHRVRDDPVENLLWILGLEEDIGGFLKLASSDPLLAHFSRKWRGWRVRSCDVWWA